MFDASIDSNTLEVHGKKLSGWKYQIDKIKNPGDANYAEYQLQYWAPGATGWANDPIKIEIPKLQVLKEVRLCVAVPSDDPADMGGYKVFTVEIGGEIVEVYRDDSRIDEDEWKAAAAAAESQGGGVYLRIEWDNDDTPPATAITYINVGEIITIDIEPLRKRLDSLESRGLVWDSSINDLERRAHVVDVSVNNLESSVYSYIPSAIKNINSSISGLKENDTSIINFIKNDVSVNLYDKIDEVSANLDAEIKDVSAYIINTVIGEGGTGLTKQINDLNSSVGRLNSSVNNLESSVYTYLPTTVNTINASITGLKENDTSIVNYIKNDVSANLYAEIAEVSAYIINTVIGEGGTGLTKQINDLNSSVSRINSSVNSLESSVYTYIPSTVNTINSSISALKDNDTSIVNYINTELTAQIDVIDSSIERINSSVSELESSVYSYLPPVLSGLRSDIDNVGTVIDERVNPRLEAVEEMVTAVDSSNKELYANYIEIIGTWAAAWNALFEANPSLQKPTSRID